MKLINVSKYSKILLTILISICLTTCQKSERYPNIKYLKILKFELEQNTDEINHINKYDSVFYNINVIMDINNSLSNAGYLALPVKLLLDYYKSINIISINKFNSENQVGDTITDLFSLTYYDEIYYTYIGKTRATTPALIINNFNVVDSTFYEHSSDLLNNNNCCHAYPFKLQLNTPPDTTVLFQIKIDIELLDGREFELYSVPVYIKP